MRVRAESTSELMTFMDRIENGTRLILIARVSGDIIFDSDEGDDIVEATIHAYSFASP